MTRGLIEYRSDGEKATTRLLELLFVDRPYPNYNGGQLAFGPDGLRYLVAQPGTIGWPRGDRASLERAPSL